MNLALARRILPAFLGTLACLAAASRASAHDPLDLSSRIVVHDDRIELTSTMGLDAARQLLTGAGYSPEEIADCFKSRGPDAVVKHPATLAPRFFQLKNNGGPLIAQSVSSLAEGMEIVLTLVYPRPKAGTLEVRAACYETIPGLRNGSLIIRAESAGQLGGALLTPARPQLTVPLPGIKPGAKTSGTGKKSQA